VDVDVWGVCGPAIVGLSYSFDEVMEVGDDIEMELLSLLSFLDDGGGLKTKPLAWLMISCHFCFPLSKGPGLSVSLGLC